MRGEAFYSFLHLITIFLKIISIFGHLKKITSDEIQTLKYLFNEVLL